MEKQGNITPENTPKVNKDKTLDKKASVEELDDDFTKRAAKKAEEELRRRKSEEAQLLSLTDISMQATMIAISSM